MKNSQVHEFSIRALTMLDFSESLQQCMFNVIKIADYNYDIFIEKTNGHKCSYIIFLTVSPNSF